jgi:hypothetical protein
MRKKNSPLHCLDVLSNGESQLEDVLTMEDSPLFHFTCFHSKTLTSFLHYAKMGSVSEFLFGWTYEWAIFNEFVKLTRHGESSFKDL